MNTTDTIIAIPQNHSPKVVHLNNYRDQHNPTRAAILLATQNVGNDNATANDNENLQDATQITQLQTIISTQAQKWWQEAIDSLQKQANESTHLDWEKLLMTKDIITQHFLKKYKDTLVISSDPKRYQAIYDFLHDLFLLANSLYCNLSQFIANHQELYPSHYFTAAPTISLINQNSGDLLPDDKLQDLAPEAVQDSDLSLFERQVIQACTQCSNAQRNELHIPHQLVNDYLRTLFSIFNQKRKLNKIS